jgi:hypothetical protein
VLDCSWDYPFEDGAVDLETRVCVAFDEIRFELAADIEIQAIEFKVMSFSLGVHELKAGPHKIHSDFFHVLEYLLLKVVVFVRVSGIEVSLELAIADFVCWFVFAVLLPSFLDGIVGQMNHLVVNILDVVFL